MRGSKSIYAAFCTSVFVLGAFVDTVHAPQTEAPAATYTSCKLLAPFRAQIERSPVPDRWALTLVNDGPREELSVWMWSDAEGRTASRRLVWQGELDPETQIDLDVAYATPRNVDRVWVAVEATQNRERQATMAALTNYDVSEKARRDTGAVQVRADSGERVHRYIGRSDGGR